MFVSGLCTGLLIGLVVCGLLFCSHVVVLQKRNTELFGKLYELEHKLKNMVNNVP